MVSTDSFVVAECRLANKKNRDYVSANYWPNKEASGTKLQQMFDKVMAASKAENGKAATNGS